MPLAKAEKLKGTKAHTRYKTADGKQVPGTTTVIGVLNKPALVKWANQIGLEGIQLDKYMDKLANIGTCAHLMVECHLKGIDPDLSEFTQEEIDKAENALISFYNWESQHQIKVIATELPLVSEEYHYGGTIDAVLEIDGNVNLVDFKTSKGIFNEHKIQLGAYRNLLEENGYTIEQYRVLRIGRDETEGFEEHVIPDLGLYWQMFLALLEVYNLQKLLNKKGA